MGGKQNNVVVQEESKIEGGANDDVIIRLGVDVNVEGDDDQTHLQNSIELQRQKSNFTFPQSFKSLLNQPFPLWNKIEEVAEVCLPTWPPTQRGRVIQNVLRFLELKVLMEDYKPNELLSPTNVVGDALRALILETRLYRHVINKMQAYHGRPKRMMHFSVVRNMDDKSCKERLERTQALFHVYYNETMISDIANDASSLTETSAITDVHGYHWGYNTPVSGPAKPMSRRRSYFGNMSCGGDTLTTCDEFKQEANKKRLKGNRKGLPRPPKSGKQYYLNQLAKVFCYDLHYSRCLCQDVVRDALVTCAEDDGLYSEVDDNDASTAFDELFYADDVDAYIAQHGGYGPTNSYYDEEKKEELSAATSGPPVETKFLIDSNGRSFPVDMHL